MQADWDEKYLTQVGCFLSDKRGMRGVSSHINSPYIKHVEK